MYQQRFNLPCWVREDVFFNMDPSKKIWGRAEIIAISSYEGEVLSFVVSQNGFIFHNIPIHLINLSDGSKRPYKDTEGDYKESSCNCARGPFYEHPLFKRDTVVWAKLQSGYYQKHKYLTTVEWDSEQNQNLHLLITPSGFLTVKTNTYVCFSEECPKEIPTWKALTYTFKV